MSDNELNAPEEITQVFWNDGSYVEEWTLLNDVDFIKVRYIRADLHDERIAELEAALQTFNHPSYAAYVNGKWVSVADVFGVENE